AYTITLRYAEADWQQAGIVDESTLNLYTWNGTAWVAVLPCSGCSLDTANNVLTAVLDHFTEFALLGGTPNKDEPTATPTATATATSTATATATSTATPTSTATATRTSTPAGTA